MYLAFVGIVVFITSEAYGTSNVTNVMRTFDPPENFDLLEALSFLRADKFLLTETRGLEILKNHTCHLQLLEYRDALINKDSWAVKSEINSN